MLMVEQESVEDASHEAKILVLPVVKLKPMAESAVQALVAPKTQVEARLLSAVVQSLPVAAVLVRHRISAPVLEETAVRLPSVVAPSLLTATITKVLVVPSKLRNQGMPLLKQ